MKKPAPLRGRLWNRPMPRRHGRVRYRQRPCGLQGHGRRRSAARRAVAVSRTVAGTISIPGTISVPWPVAVILRLALGKFAREQQRRAFEDFDGLSAGVEIQRIDAARRECELQDAAGLTEIVFVDGDVALVDAADKNRVSARRDI